MLEDTMSRKAAFEDALSVNEVAAVSPALEQYGHRRLFGDVWTRPGLTPRDRSMVTVAALIARSQPIELRFQIGLALEHGVTPREISEIITHLAFYSGWGNAMTAVHVAKDVYERHGVDAQQLPSASPELLPLDEATEARRAANVEQQMGAIVPALVHYTTDVLFLDLWLRPDLAPRDRSLVTVSALITSGQVAQIPFHLNRAMDNGLTQIEAAEMIAHLAFYAGWPSAMSAVPIATDVFNKRQH
jgi:4-carboxymuconolactone decarboxylase